MLKFSHGLMKQGIRESDRVAFYLPKQFETVVSIFGTSLAGATFVPVNPVLKAQQVTHILRDCGAKVLITSVERAEILREELSDCPELQKLVLTNLNDKDFAVPGLNCLGWNQLVEEAPLEQHKEVVTASDVAAILYTSGSTGRPKALCYRILIWSQEPKA